MVTCASGRGIGRPWKIRWQYQCCSIRTLPRAKHSIVQQSNIFGSSRSHMETKHAIILATLNLAALKPTSDFATIFGILEAFWAICGVEPSCFACFTNRENMKGRNEGFCNIVCMKTLFFVFNFIFWVSKLNRTSNQLSTKDLSLRCCCEDLYAPF